MKNIKTFESFQDDKVNEGLGTILKSILLFPVSLIAAIGMQFVDGRIISRTIKERLLNIYANIDTLISTLENLLTLSDVTDTEKRKILTRLKELKKVKEKYPTFEVYKAKLSKHVPLYNFKNREYLRNQIWEYEPIQMNASEVVSELRKVYTLIKRNNVVGDVRGADFDFGN
jgi:hypothetical protein